MSIRTYYNKDGELVTLDTETGALVTTEGERKPIKYAYTMELGQYICSLLTRGYTKMKAAKELNLPPHIVSHWCRTVEGFREQVELAIRDRAEHYHDRVMEQADNEDVHKDFVPWKKVKIDALKWAAEKGDPDRYGNKTKVAPTTQ